MSVYKDSTQGTWYAVFRYVDWAGKKKQKVKRDGRDYAYGKGYGTICRKIFC